MVCLAGPLLTLIALKQHLGSLNLPGRNRPSTFPAFGDSLQLTPLFLPELQYLSLGHSFLSQSPDKDLTPSFRRDGILARAIAGEAHLLCVFYLR